MESFLASSVNTDEVVGLLPWLQLSGDFRAQLEHVYNAVERRKHGAVVFILDRFSENASHERFQVEYLSNDGIRLGDHFDLWRLRD